MLCWQHGRPKLRLTTVYSGCWSVCSSIQLPDVEPVVLTTTDYVDRGLSPQSFISCFQEKDLSWLGDHLKEELLHRQTFARNMKIWCAVCFEKYTAPPRWHALVTGLKIEEITVFSFHATLSCFGINKHVAVAFFLPCFTFTFVTVFIENILFLFTVNYAVLQLCFTATQHSIQPDLSLSSVLIYVVLLLFVFFLFPEPLHEFTVVPLVKLITWENVSHEKEYFHFVN